MQQNTATFFMPYDSIDVVTGGNQGNGSLEWSIRAIHGTATCMLCELKRGFFPQNFCRKNWGINF
jgi:hypothetical protein